MIDGIERTNFDGIDPNEVESLNILKDASATAIYGVKGANGVVLITTRKGERGRPRLSYSGNFALQQSTQLPSYLNSADYATLYNEALENDSRVSGSTYNRNSRIKILNCTEMALIRFCIRTLTG